MILKGVTTEDFLFYTLVVCGAGVLASFLWATRKGGRYENFHFLDAITSKNGHFDATAFQERIVFALMAWGFVMYVKRDKLPEWYITIFVGAFVLRSAYSAWLRNRGDREDKVIGRTTIRRDVHEVTDTTGKTAATPPLPPVPPPEDRREL